MGKPQNKRKKQSESDVSESLSDSEDSGAEVFFLPCLFV